jgi:DNA phosphorothioation-dependent restriction protein DptG
MGMTRLTAGESGPAQLAVGLGEVITDFHARGLPFDRTDEYASINYYENVLQAADGDRIRAQLTASEFDTYFTNH